MSDDLIHDTHALIGLLRHHPELLHEKANRDRLHALVVVVRAALDSANLESLHSVLAELEEDFRTEP